MILTLVLISYALTAGKYLRQLMVLATHPFSVFSALRLFAVSERNTMLSCIVLIQGLAPVIVNSVGGPFYVIVLFEFSDS